MPTYDYECQGCDHHFERWQEMSARKLRTCPECGKKKLLRLVGAGAGVIFKGSGFYETDYKRKQQPQKSTSDPSTSDPSKSPSTNGKPAPSGKEGSKSSGKADTKSPAKSDAKSK